MATDPHSPSIAINTILLQQVSVDLRCYFHSRIQLPLEIVTQMLPL